MFLKGHLDWASFGLAVLLQRGATLREQRNAIEDLAYSHKRLVDARR